LNQTVNYSTVRHFTADNQRYISRPVDGSLHDIWAIGCKIKNIIRKRWPGLWELRKGSGRFQQAHQH
jgi:hypothetical protein